MIEAAALIRNLQARVRRLETLEDPAGGCLTLIEDIKLIASATSITFSSIPQTYRHLWLWINSSVVIGSGNASSMRMTYNGDNGLNYRYFFIRHIGIVPVASGGVGSTNFIALETPGAAFTGSDPIFNGMELNIYDYTSTAKEKSCTWKSWIYLTATGGEGPPATTSVALGGGHYKTEGSAITSITVSKGAVGGDLGIGSQFTLYGLC